MSILNADISAQQHGARTTVGIVANQAILLCGGRHMLLHCGPFMAGKTELFPRNRQDHFNRVPIRPGRVTQHTGDLSLGVHRCALSHIGMTQSATRVAARDCGVIGGEE